MSTLSLVNSQFLASQGHKPDCNSDMNDRCEKGDGKINSFCKKSGWKGKKLRPEQKRV